MLSDPGCYTIGHERARAKNHLAERGSVSYKVIVPAAIAHAGEHAARRFIEFFAATIRNKNTRMA